jgi:hypothetical protein
MIDDEVIETSDDTEDEGKSGLYPYDPTQADIDIRESPLSIFELMRRYNDGRLIVDPEFQRSDKVWNFKQKSQFIESIILNFPLPPFYVSETREGKYIIVDGLQRTTALYEFMTEKFSLKGLEALVHLNDKSFSDLKVMSGAYQTKIEDKKITLYVLRPSVPMEVVFDLFKRVNTGGTSLTRQEIRNCIFIGKATTLLKELAESDDFKKAIDNGIKPDRMKDREAILRYIAFQIFNYKEDYSGDMSAFLEKTMRTLNKMSDDDILKLKENFNRTMQLSYSFFGDKNFRVPLMGKTTRGRINIAVLESVGYFFSHEEDNFLHKYKEGIIKKYSELLENKDYLDAVQNSTGNTSKVFIRFTLITEFLGNPSC